MDLTRPTALPDADYDAEFYADVPAKRLMAWVIDVAIIAAITLILTLLGFFLPLFFLPLLFAVVSFLYRWATITGGSATIGMRFMAIELRNRQGDRLSGSVAFLHTLGYVISIATVPLQLVSIIMMLTTPRRQGLTDMVLGTAAVNR